jgi:hypothetical protein
MCFEPYVRGETVSLFIDVACVLGMVAVTAALALYVRFAERS